MKRHQPSMAYKSWSNMMGRCYRPTHIQFKDWGGRGITVAPEWHSFDAFFRDMGDRTQGMSLDRIDNNGHYCALNCRWASASEQARNRRSSRLLTAFGETKTLVEWSEDPRCAVPRTALGRRLCLGWSDVDAITQPARPRRSLQDVAGVPRDRDADGRYLRALGAA